LCRSVQGFCPSPIDLPSHDWDTRDWPSVVVTKAEHQAFTNQWLKEIPRGMGMRKATADQINDAARKIYSGYPEFLDSLGLR
jgi:hypothetical protein